MAITPPNDRNWGPSPTGSSCGKRPFHFCADSRLAALAAKVGKAVVKDEDELGGRLIRL